MSEALTLQSMLEDFADEWDISDEIVYGDAINLTATDYQRQKNTFLTCDFWSTSKTRSSTLMKPSSDISYVPQYDREEAMIEHLPSEFEDRELTFTSSRVQELRCSDCKGKGFKHCNCSGSDDCSTCGGNGTYSCYNCDEGVVYKWREGAIEYEVREGKTGIAQNGDIPMDVIENVEAEGDHLTTKVNEYEPGDELPRATKASAIGGKINIGDDGVDVLRHKKEVYGVQVVCLTFEYDGTEYDVYRLDGEWYKPKSILKDLGSRKYKRRKYALDATKLLLVLGILYWLGSHFELGSYLAF